MHAFLQGLATAAANPSFAAAVILFRFLSLAFLIIIFYCLPAAFVAAAATAAVAAAATTSAAAAAAAAALPRVAA